MNKTLEEYLKFAKPFLDACNSYLCVYNLKNELVYKNKVVDNGDENYMMYQNYISVDNEIIGLISTYEDISNVKKLKREISKTEQKVRNINFKVTFDDIIYNSESMHKIVLKAKKIALTSANIIIQGDTGTGKESLARAIVDKSLRDNEKIL